MEVWENKPKSELWKSISTTKLEAELYLKEVAHIMEASCSF